MKLSPKIIIQYLVFFGLAILLMRYVMKDIDPASLWQKIKTANPLYMILIGVVGILSIISRAKRWQILIEPVTKRPNLLNTIFSIFISYGVNFVTPRLGEIARCGILARYEGVEADKLAGTMIAERLFDMLSLLIVAFLMIALSYQDISAYLFSKFGFLAGKLTTQNMILFLGIVILGIIALRMLTKKAASSENKLAKIFTNVKTGILSVFQLKKSGWFLFHSVFIWLCYGLMTYLGFKALQGTVHLDYKAAINVLGFGSLGFITTPGGTGAYQMIVKDVLNQIYKIDQITGSAFGMLSWALQNGILILGAFISLILFPVMNRGVQKDLRNQD
jgi:hypothetical protein